MAALHRRQRRPLQAHTTVTLHDQARALNLPNVIDSIWQTIGFPVRYLRSMASREDANPPRSTAGVLEPAAAGSIPVPLPSPCRSASGPRYAPHPLPTRNVPPCLAAWVEKRCGHPRLWIESRDAVALQRVALPARRPQIVAPCRPAQRLGHQVLDLQRNARDLLAGLAVAAPPARVREYLRPQPAPYARRAHARATLSRTSIRRVVQQRHGLGPQHHHPVVPIDQRGQHLLVGRGGSTATLVDERVPPARRTAEARDQGSCSPGLRNRPDRSSRPPASRSPGPSLPWRRP